MGRSVTEVDVLIVGGGAGGVGAAWQAARMGACVLVAEPSPWLGGMITSAGVSAFDGNKGALASGLFLKFRRGLEAHYGGAPTVDTGWISHTCFEPKVAKDLLAGYLGEAGAEVWLGADLKEVLVVEGSAKRVDGAVFLYNGTTQEVRAKVTIEATEYGDVIHRAGVPHRLGRDCQADTGEPSAPAEPDMLVQDMTWCAILQKVTGTAKPVPRPANYDPAQFDCSTAEVCSTPDPEYLNHPLHDWESFISYAALPNDKYLLNWPFHSNDSPDSVGIFGTAKERQEAFRLAKERTLAYVHYMQNELGHAEWGLAEDEFGTPDHLPFIPYVRESRRAKTVTLMREQDVVPKPGEARAPLRTDAIAIGDYFLDHHHHQDHLPPGERLEENLPDNAPFQIPYGCLVPEGCEGLLVAEKSIGVTHIVNGCTRLQPVVMLTGQAAGAAAAMCAAQDIQPAELDVSALQGRLIDEGVALYPFSDLYNDHPDFAATQRAALRSEWKYLERLEYRK